MPKKAKQPHIVSYEKFKQALIDGSNDYLKKRAERDIGDCTYHGPKGIRRARHAIERAQSFGPESHGALLGLAWAVFSSSSNALSRLIAMRMIAGEDTHFRASFYDAGRNDNLSSAVFSEASLLNRKPFVESSVSEDHCMDQYQHEQAARQFIMEDIALFHSSKANVVAGETKKDRAAAFAKWQSTFFSGAYRLQKELEHKPETASRKADAVSVSCLSCRS